MDKWKKTLNEAFYSRRKVAKVASELKRSEDSIDWCVTNDFARTFHCFLSLSRFTGRLGGDMKVTVIRIEARNTPGERKKSTIKATSVLV